MEHSSSQKRRAPYGRNNTDVYSQTVNDYLSNKMLILSSPDQKISELMQVEHMLWQ